MKTHEKGMLLRIFIDESDRCKGMPLFEAIIQRARDKGLTGATILKGVEGFGVHGQIHTAKILRLSENLPIVIEIVDIKEKIEPFLTILDEIIQEGVVTIEDVNIIKYRRNQK